MLLVNFQNPAKFCSCSARCFFAIRDTIRVSRDCVASSHDSTILLSIALNSSHIIYGTFGDIYQPQEKITPRNFRWWALGPALGYHQVFALLAARVISAANCQVGKMEGWGSFHGISKAMGDTPIAGCFYLGMGYPYFRKPPYESAWVK